MSNQEAIALLRNLEDALDSYCELNEEGKAAFRMAITALELFGNSEQLPSAQPEQQIPQMRGWVCPVCGRGLSPYTSVCPCNNGKGWEITC